MLPVAIGLETVGLTLIFPQVRVLRAEVLCEVIINEICNDVVVVVITEPEAKWLIFVAGLPALLVTVTVAGLDASNSKPDGALSVMVPDLISPFTPSTNIGPDNVVNIPVPPELAVLAEIFSPPVAEVTVALANA